MSKPKTPICAVCEGIGYVRCELPPSHRLFGRAICCPKCGKQAQLDALTARWPVTPSQKAFGLTPFCDRADENDYPAVLLAFQTVKCFLKELPDNRLLALHGKPGCGKSHLLLVLHHQALMRQVSTIYVTAPELQARIQQFDDNDRRLRDWHDLTTVDLLIVDELDDLLGEKIQPFDKLRAPPRLLQLIKLRARTNRACAFAFNRADRIWGAIKSRLEAKQKWAPENPNGKSTRLACRRTGWVDLTSVPDARPIYGSNPRPTGEANDE